MQMGVVGLGKMGANMVRRLLRDGHECVVYDRDPAPVRTLAAEGAAEALSLEDFACRLVHPRAIWLMLPAATVDQSICDLLPLLREGDTVIDGGNSHYVDDIRRAGELARRGIHYLDVGTSGGVWGLERGYCMMIGGPRSAVLRLDAIFRSLAPGRGAVAPASGREGRNSTAENGYLHCGPAGAGHFVKMVHNGIEYGLMAAYAEGFDILRHAGIGTHALDVDAETTPLPHPERFRYQFDLADIAELWRRGSVIGSWLLDLTARALAKQPDLTSHSGRVSDSGEGRWTVLAAVEEGVPTPVLAAALLQRFASRGENEFSNRLLSALRFEFGGHLESPPLVPRDER